jgi:hypothetical protein
VELRGSEPRTSCMPFLAESSEGVEMGRAPAGQTGCSVCLHLAVAEAVFVRSHLVSHWSFGSPARGMLSTEQNQRPHKHRDRRSVSACTCAAATSPPRISNNPLSTTQKARGSRGCEYPISRWKRPRPQLAGSGHGPNQDAIVGYRWRWR